MVRQRRKSPRRHHVRSYQKQNGNYVRDYTRGKGTSSTLIHRRKIEKPKSFTVNFRYSDKPRDGESVVVIAQSYEKALDEAWEERRDTRAPIAVEIVDPNLGKVFRVLAKGAGQAVKLGARFAWVGAKTITKETAHAVAKSYRELRLRRLIDEAYSTDKVTRVLARGKLKQRYPEIYKICDFSKEKN